MDLIFTTAFVYLSYSGVTKVAAIAEEIKNPSKNLPQGMILSLVIITIIYIAISFVLTGAVSLQDLNENYSPLHTLAVDLSGSGYDINGINFVSQLIENLPPKELRSIFDKFKSEKSKSILACITTNEDKVSIIVGLTNDLIDTYDARVLIKSTFDILGSKGGGGRIDFAQAGGNKKDQLNQAFLSIKNQI